MLTVSELRVKFGDAEAVRGVSFEVGRGGRVGLVGESGAGKSLTALAVAGLLPDGAVASGGVVFEGTDLMGLTERQLARLRGSRISFVFQDPMTALNPAMRVGTQVGEMLRLHRGASRRAAQSRAVELLQLVGLPSPAAKARAYPHQLSGGQRQRVMIAAAMACNPSLLIADEPTTALDVTVQAEILALLQTLVAEQGTSLLMITHDLPVIASQCEEVLVMYGGQIVEHGPARAVFASARHPYTAGLISAQPNPPGHGERARRLPVIPGVVPPLGQFPSGCAFRDRCGRATAECASTPPVVMEPWLHRCFHPVEPNITAEHAVDAPVAERR